MLKMIQVEFMKFRHNRLCMVCAVIAFAFPLLVALKDWQIHAAGAQDIGFNSWCDGTRDIGLTLILTILSGFLVTFFCQKEYAERTIISQLTCSISRINFLIGKLSAWAIWHVVLTLIFFISTGIGAAILYPHAISVSIFLQIAWQFLMHGIWIFLSMLPLFAAAIVQREIFYPSLLLTLAMTLISTFAYVMKGLLPFLLPWSAARLLGTEELDGTYLIISLLSVIICAIIGWSLSLVGFLRQDI